MAATLAEVIIISCVRVRSTTLDKPWTLGHVILLKGHVIRKGRSRDALEKITCAFGESHVMLGVRSRDAWGKVT